MKKSEEKIRKTSQSEKTIQDVCFVFRSKTIFDTILTSSDHQGSLIKRFQSKQKISEIFIFFAHRHPQCWLFEIVWAIAGPLMAERDS